MDRTTVFTKTAKGLMEATGKTSVLSRDLRALLKEIDGKATVGEVQTKLGKVPEAKLQESLKALAKGDFIREFSRATPPVAPPPAAPAPKGHAAPPPKGPAAGGEMDLDFTTAIPTLSTITKQAEEAAKQKAQAAAAAEAAARAKAAAEAAARAKAEAEARARARAEAAAKARAEAEARAKIAAAAVAGAKSDARPPKEAEAAGHDALDGFFEARERQESEARTKHDAGEQARREADAKAKAAAAEAAARARAEAEARAKAAAEAAARAKAEAEARARAEAEARAKAEAEARAKRDAEERARREAEERARKEAEARAKAEQQARIEAEARARKEAEERARVEAELKAKLEEERKAREEAERRAKEQAERERKAAEEKARREADELRAELEEERKAREEAERKAKGETERKAREDAERKAKEDAERSAKEQAERIARETEARERREAEEQSRKIAEDKARAEAAAARAAEEDARRTAAQQAQAPAAPAPGPSLEDLVKIEIDFDAVPAATPEVKVPAAQRQASAEDKMLKELEERARKDAEAQARREAEEKARIEAEAEEKREEEERGRKDEKATLAPRDEVKPRAEPVPREHDYAEEKALLDAQNEETERHFADMEKELDAEAAAATHGKIPPEPREDTRRRDKDAARALFGTDAAVRAGEASAAAEEPRVAYRTPIKWGKPVALVLFAILILGVVGIHFASFDGQIPQFEKLAGAHLQQPVKIKALHLSLVPLPHWRLDGVSVGNEGQLAVAQIKAAAELGSMFSDKKVFKSIELESPVLSEQGLIALLFGKPQGQDLKVASIIVRNGKLNSKTIVLPVLDAKIAMGADGGWQKIALETPDHKTNLLLEPKGEDAQIEVETNAFSMPFGPAFILENFSAKGVIGRNELRLSEFKGAIYGGYLSGNASLKWGADWSLGGEINVRAMDPGSIAPALLDDGKLEGKAVYAMRAKSYDELFAVPRLEGTFDVQKGSLLGVDLARLLQGGGVGGKTAFSELTGSFVREGGRTQLRQVRLAAGPVSAGGSADADAGKNISGRFAVELKSPVAQARANLAVSGTLREPRFSR